MNLIAFKSLINAFLESRNEINIYFVHQNIYYKYTIYNRLISVLKCDVDGVESEYTISPQDIHFEGTVKFLKVHELIYAMDGSVLEENIIHCKTDMQVYLKAFRVLGENVSFLVQHDEGVHDCFFIYGKVLYYQISEDEQELVLYEDNLYSLYKTFKNPKIMNIAKRRDRTNLSMFRNSVFKLASDHNIRYSSVKKGVRMS